jgi:ABC-type dipeptide/oligopeptide/nickel transport system ATPase component
MGKILEIKNLNIQFKKTGGEIVRGVDFSVNDGQALCIVGESGCGKTMTSKAMLGLLNPNVFTISGSCIFRGQELIGMKPKALAQIRGSSLAMIMQNPMTSFAPATRIGKQMAAPVLVHSKANRRTVHGKIVQMLKKMNLPQPEKIMRSYPHELSGGMLQRVMIALTLLLEPRMIIADEATTAVDVVSEEIILREFMRIKKLGISLLVITHDFGVAAALADYIAVMKDGVLVEEGLPQAVFTTPAHDYTKELLHASLLTKGNYAQSV